MASIKDFLRRGSGVLYRIAARWMVAILPCGAWYRAAFQISRLQMLLLRPLAMVGVYPYRRDIAQWPNRKKVIQARVMNTWLRNLAAYRRNFPIPVRIYSGAPLPELPVTGSGIVICTVHCFLVDACLGAIVKLSGGDLTVTTREAELKQGCPVCGTDRVLPTVFTDQSVLLKMKSILRRGGSVVALVDSTLGAPLSANALRLARMVDARVLFGVPELQPDGEILLEMHEAPPLRCGGDELIQTTIHRLDELKARILQIDPHTKGS